VRQGLNRKEIWLKYDTHKIKWTNRVKGKNLILNLWAGLDGSPGLMTVQEKLATIQQNRARKLTCSKFITVVAPANKTSNKKNETKSL
jgi:hypothetical protein